ncbi:MAG: benzoyl-CoA 2,3-epoxidase subunit BoxA [Rhodobacterales bacterium]|nr:benzoyl-CoA 2,3-epoxidase subunit BoxA [Rhodobacterales bacterium]
MSAPFKQHLIDPEICIRCYACEAACPIEAIEHGDDNVVVNADKCDHEGSCVAVCPTGAIDEWRVVNTAYSLDQQHAWEDLPEQGDITADVPVIQDENATQDDPIAALLAEAHKGAGGKASAPATASKPQVNLFNLGTPAKAIVQGSYRLTGADSDADVRHIILDLGTQNFPFLEGQSIGIIPPGVDNEGRAFAPRLYSISSPRDGERAGFNNLSLTVKRHEDGVCSNFLCDLEKGDTLRLTGPFGTTFLLPNDQNAKLLMICTGTGSAPFRGFTMRRQRENPFTNDGLILNFGARRPEDLPYFGPLNKIPESFMKKWFAFSRIDDHSKQYVQDKLRVEKDMVAEWLRDDATHIYVCGLQAMEHGVDEALADIARGAGLDWDVLKVKMRENGRYHVETY